MGNFVKMVVFHYSVTLAVFTVQSGHSILINYPRFLKSTSVIDIAFKVLDSGLPAPAEWQIDNLESVANDMMTGSESSDARSQYVVHPSEVIQQNLIIYK